jgi:hypothetical protein
MPIHLGRLFHRLGDKDVDCSLSAYPLGLAHSTICVAEIGDQTFMGGLGCDGLLASFVALHLAGYEILGQAKVRQGDRPSRPFELFGSVLHQPQIHVSECKKRLFGHGKQFAPELLRLFGAVPPPFSRFPFSDGPAQC